MKDYLQESCKHKQKVFIVDAAGIFGRYPLHFHGFFITTPSIINEIKDEESKRVLEFMLNSGKLKVYSPKHEYIKKVMNTAKKLGEMNILSQADLEITALYVEALEKGCEAIMVSDDYSIQNLVKYIGGKFVTIKTKGIKKTFKYVSYCPHCGYVGKPDKGEICPICGSSMKRKTV